MSETSSNDPTPESEPESESVDETASFSAEDADPIVSGPAGPVPGNPTTAASPDGPPAPTGRSRGQRIALSAAALVVAAGLGVGAAKLTSDDSDDAAAAAASGGNDGEQGAMPAGGPGAAGFGPGASGTIDEIGDDSLAVSSDDGESVEVAVSDDTVIVDTVEGSTDDLAEGQSIRVVSQDTGDDAAESDDATESDEGDSDDAVTAAQVTVAEDEELLSPGGPGGGGGAFPGGGGDGSAGGQAPPIPRGDGESDDGQMPEPPEDGELPQSDGSEMPSDGEMPEPPEGGEMPGGFGGLVAGTIESIDGDTVTVETEDGTVTVTLTDDTEVRVVSEIELDDLEVGDEVQATGESDDDGGTLTATRISRGELVQGPGGGQFPVGDDRSESEDAG